MDILMVCHYGLYRDLSYSFVHGQARAYAALGHRVRVIIPIGLGKRSPDGNRFGPKLVHQQADAVDLYYMRYLTASHYGETHFNPASATVALRSVLPIVLKDFSPDVIHAHTLGFDSKLGGWLKHRLGLPLVVTTHGSDSSLPYEQGRLAYLRKCCDVADRVVAVSSALAKKLQRCGTTTPIVSILNGVELSHIPSSFDKAPLSLLQVGHLTRQKQADTTIRALASLRQSHPEATLTLVGQGPECESLQQLCQQLNIANAVRFTGQLPHSQVLEEMAKAQFFVLPSTREGFGVVYAEAMACGCLTIGTQDEGIADLITNGKNGFLVPAKHPEAIVSVIMQCLEDPAMAIRIAQAGQQVAQTLTWENNARQYVAMIRELKERG